jgi:hypothetical protein
MIRSSDSRVSAPWRQRSCKPNRIWAWTSGARPRITTRWPLATGELDRHQAAKSAISARPARCCSHQRTSWGRQSPRVRLPGADLDLARAEAGQRLRSRVPQEIFQRQPGSPAAVLVRNAQPQPPGADRAGAAARRADDLSAVPAAGRPGGDELLIAQAASPPDLPAGVAEPVGHPPLARAAPDEAEPVPEQRMAWRGRKSPGLRVPPGPAEEIRLKVIPEIPSAAVLRAEPGKGCQVSAHRGPPATERAATWSTAFLSRP